MKMKLRERLEQIYDALFAEAEKILKEANNVCEFRKTSDGAVCAGCSIGYVEPKTLCCEGCKYHSVTQGCRAEKPLACKTWLCVSRRGARPDVEAKLAQIRTATESFGFYKIRGDKDESLDQAIDYKTGHSEIKKILNVLRNENVWNYEERHPTTSSTESFGKALAAA